MIWLVNPDSGGLYSFGFLSGVKGRFRPEGTPDRIFLVRIKICNLWHRFEIWKTEFLIFIFVHKQMAYLISTVEKYSFADHLNSLKESTAMKLSILTFCLVACQSPPSPCFAKTEGICYF